MVLMALSLLFSLLSIQTVYSEEYWTGTSGDDKPAAILYGSMGYVVVWNSGGYIYVTTIDLDGNVGNNTRIRIGERNVTAIDAVLNGTLLYIVANDVDNDTIFYVIKYDLGMYSIDYCRWFVLYNYSGQSMASKPVAIDHGVLYGYDHVFVLIDSQGVATILSLDPINGDILSSLSIMITNSTYTDMVYDNGYLHILGYVYVSNSYRILLVRTDMSAFNITSSLILYGEQAVFVRPKSILVSKNTIYVLAGVGAGGAPAIYQYTGLFMYKATDLSLVQYKIFSTTGYRFGYGPHNPNKIINGSRGFYITGFLANSTDLGLQDIFIAGFDYVSLNNTWAVKWDGFNGVERGVAITYGNGLVVTAGFSPIHNGVFDNVSLVEHTGYSVYSYGVTGEISEYNSLSDYVKCLVSNVSRVQGINDIVVLSVDEYGSPVPIPEPSDYILYITITTLILAFICVSLYMRRVIR